jgi:uncharacterized phage infection (PIP) family protein YhgE
MLKNIGKNNMKIAEQLESLTQDEINFIYNKFEKAVALANEELKRKQGFLEFTKNLEELVSKHLTNQDDKPAQGKELVQQLEDTLEKVKQDIEIIQSITNKFKDLVEVIN